MYYYFSHALVLKKNFLHPDSVSPEIYEVLLDNDDVKVMMVTFKPGQGDKMHDHNPMTFHVLRRKSKVTLLMGLLMREKFSGFTGHSTTDKDTK